MFGQIAIDADALRHNYRFFEKRVGRDRFVPVLKSNAYGHGLAEVYSVIAPLGPAWICVNYLEEAGTLRALGYRGRILACGPFVPEQVPLALEHDVDVFIGTQQALAAVLGSKKPVRCHIEFDTGMSRQGFAPELAPTIAAQLVSRPELLVGVCMHFANVEDVLEHDYADLQLQRFKMAQDAFLAQGLKPLFHAASSASTLILAASILDLHRIGVSLYGQWPSQATRLSFHNEAGNVDALRPVLSWTAPLTSVIQISAGQYVGYGCTYRANRPMAIGVIPVGYHEGLPRAISGSQAHVLVRGKRCPVVGRVCMNMTMIDVTEVAGVAVGDKATIIGCDGAEAVSAADVANWANTIHYEILAGLNAAVPRAVVKLV